jgi:serine/threonine-protein kinase
LSKAFSKQDWFIGLVVTLLFFLLAGTDSLRRLEWVAYDLGVRYSRDRPANTKVVVIAIDDASVKALGPWPWSRAILARVNNRLGSARAAVIGYMLPFDSPQNEGGLRVLRELEQNQRKALGKKGRTLVKEAVRRLDTDRSLAASFRAWLLVFAEPAMWCWRFPIVPATALPSPTCRQPCKNRS